MAANETETPFTADVVVVGSGSAGAVVARRLVDAGAQVLVLEAGLPGRQPGDPRSRPALRALGRRAGLGLPHRAADPAAPGASCTGRAATCSADRAR